MVACGKRQTECVSGLTFTQAAVGKYYAFCSREAVAYLAFLTYQAILYDGMVQQARPIADDRVLTNNARPDENARICRPHNGYIA